MLTSTPAARADLRHPRVRRRVAGRAVDQRRAGGVGRLQLALDERDPPLGRPAPTAAAGRGAVDHDPRLGLHQQAQLRHRDRPGAGDDDTAVAQIEKYRVVSHAFGLGIPVSGR